MALPKKNESLELVQNTIVLNITQSDTPCADQAKKNRAALKAIGLGEDTIEVIVDSDFQRCLDNTYG